MVRIWHSVGAGKVLVVCLGAGALNIKIPFFFWVHFAGLAPVSLWETVCSWGCGLGLTFTSLLS